MTEGTGGDEPQNIYDDPRFFAGYSQLERFGTGWERAMERETFLSLLPAVGGLRVLDLGCGAGQLAHYLAEQGAAEVIGVDVSERMLALARSEWAHPRVTYRREAMERLSFPDARFDLVVSSLALHYVADYRGLAGRIARWLTPGGALVFSTEHPIYTARSAASDDGWVMDADGARTGWAIDAYADEGVREHEWFVEGVRRYHRTMATLLNGLIDVGLTVGRIEEPVAEGEWLRARPHAADERRRPMFLLVQARRAV